MSITRSTALGLGLFLAALSAHAMGCAGNDAGPVEGSADDAVASAGEAAKWHGCPSAGPISAYARTPSHAFPGHCHGPADAQQAHQDDAPTELEANCRAYCAQSTPQCAAHAEIHSMICMDGGNAGHRWGATCSCQ
jgi:hypothetical protein